MNSRLSDKNRRILVIDDNRAIHEDFRKILCPASIASAAGLEASEAALFGPRPHVAAPTRFELDSAYQGQEGAQMVQQALAAGRPYAMAFVDVRMPPGWDGVETTRKLWEIDPSLQIVICTAYSDYTWGELIEQLGQSDGLLILKKPFDAVEALQLANALTEKWQLRQQSRVQMEQLENRVAERTHELQAKTALLEAQLNSTLDGILVVDRAGRKVLQNQRVIELFSIPPDIADGIDDAAQVRWVANVVKDPKQFGERVAHLYAHPEETSRDEIALNNGVILDRYSAPVIGPDGTYHGRIWTFRDITERKQSEEVLRQRANLQEQLAHTAAAVPGMIYSLRLRPDGSTQMPYVSGALKDVFDLQPEDVVGDATPVFSLMHPEDLGHVQATMAESARTLNPWRDEFRVNHARLGEIWVEGHSVPQSEPDGSVLWNGFVQNITGRKLAEKALRESERRFSEMLHNLELVSVMLDQDARITYCNDFLLQLTGWRREEVLGRDWFEVFLPPEVVKELREVHSAALADRPFALHYENEIVTRSGERRLIHWNNTVLRSPTGGVIGSASIGEDITKRKLAEAALQQERNLLRTLIDNIPNEIYVRDKSNRFVLANESFARLMGVAGPSALIGKSDADFYPPEEAALFGSIDQGVLAGRESINEERLLHFPNGQELVMLTNKVPLRNEKGEVIGLIGISHDITERKRTEAALFQSQKMETVGKLAGGVAHEFNTLLTTIIGQSESLLVDLPGGSPLAHNVTEVRKAADRAASLTRQLLAYGRKQMLQPRVLDLNQVVASMDEVLRHLMGGENLAVRFVAGPGQHLVKADAGQIEQVILNLAMNARDAMPNGGKLTLETALVTFEQDSVGRNPELKPGNYVMLAISDTGRGMSEAVKARAFEPFFTTKGVGQGTGLGLSTCHGIVKQSGGHISVYSEPGRGTIFKIYLPQVDSPEPDPVQRPDLPDLPRGTETILLVEDDAALRDMAATLLKRLGYAVVAAANGVDALSLANERNSGRIDLLFTDLVMPHIGGKELAERVRSLYPHMRILFTSAYTEQAIAHQGAGLPGVALLQKPFTPSALARRVRAALDQPTSPAADPAQRPPGLEGID